MVWFADTLVFYVIEISKLKSKKVITIRINSIASPLSTNFDLSIHDICKTMLVLFSITYTNKNMGDKSLSDENEIKPSNKFSNMEDVKSLRKCKLNKLVLISVLIHWDWNLIILWSKLRAIDSLMLLEINSDSRRYSIFCPWGNYQ